MVIKPYALLTLSNQHFAIMRYNVTEEDWKMLPDYYSNEVDAKAELEILNQEAGTVII